MTEDQKLRFYIHRKPGPVCRITRDMANESPIVKRQTEKAKVERPWLFCKHRHMAGLKCPITCNADHGKPWVECKGSKCEHPEV